MIIRSPRARNFTVIGNEIFDSGLSLEAIGLLCYILSRPDNWQILPAQLAAKFGGRDRTYRILNELVSAFYIDRQKLVTGKMQYTVFDVPTPNPEKPDLVENSQILKSRITEKPDPEKPDVLTRTESKQELKEIGKTEKSVLSISDWPHNFREEFWNRYPRRIAKQAAMKALEKVHRSGTVRWSVLIAALEKFSIWAKTKEIQYVKHPASWINAGCWDDELTAGEFKNGFGGSRPLQDDSRSAGRAAGRLAEAARNGQFSFAPIPSLLPREGGDDVRLLPEGRGAEPGDIRRIGRGDV